MDARIIKTKKYLKEALISLLANSNINDINVARLCKVAEINRTTFYTHYKNVSDVYDELVKEYDDNVCNYLSLIYSGDGNIDNVIEFIKYIDKNSDVFMLIFQNNNNLDNNKEAYQELEKVFKNKFKLSPINIDYIINHFIYAGGSIFYTWIKNGKKESREEIAKIIRKLVLNGPVSLLK